MDMEWTYGELLEKFQDINAHIQILRGKKVRVLSIVSLKMKCISIEVVLILEIRTISIKQLKRNSCHTCASSGVRSNKILFFLN